MSSGLPWFALQVRTPWEKMAAGALVLRGYECLLPLYVSRRRWSDRIKEIELPLFPGYLFCQFDPAYRLPILQTRGVLQIVGIGKTPIPVDDVEIAAIRCLLQSRLPREPWPFIQIGQYVRIEDGPLRGLSGIVVDVKSQMKLILSVSLLRRSVAVEIHPSWVSLVPEGQSADDLEMVRRCP